MAWIRQSPGVYKNDQTGEVRRSATKPSDSPAAKPAAAPAASNPGLDAARANLQQQVASGGINQAQADAEYNRLVSIGYTGPAAQPVSASPIANSLKPIFANDPALAAAVQPAVDLAGLGKDPAAGFFAPGSLGRVDETQSQSQKDILAQAAANSTAANQQNPYATQGLDQLAALSKTAGNVDPNLQLALDTRKAGLDGYTPAEMQAFREQNLPQMDNELNSALRAARIGGLNSNLSGGMNLAALPGIIQGNQEATRGLERDIFLGNIAEKNNRLAGFENLAGNIDQNRYARQFDTNNALIGAGQNQQQINTAGRSQSLQDWSNINSATRDDILNRSIFNLNQIGREKAGQTGVLFGTLGLAGQTQGNQQAYDLAKQQLEVAKIQAENAGRSSAPSFTSYSPVNTGSSALSPQPTPYEGAV